MKRLEREKVIRGAYRSAILALTICCVFLGAVLVVHELAREYEVKKLNAKLDAKGVLVENSSVAESVKFALLFEFDGDINAIRHVLYNCSASRPSIESETKEDTIEPGTETLSITADPRSDGLVKARTGDTTDETTYKEWYKTVYTPTEEGGGMA